MNNHTDALRKLRDCSFRLSESPDFEDETPDLDFLEIATKRSKISVEEVYDTLIQMSERSTDSIRPTSLREKALVDEELWYECAEQDKTLFYDFVYDHKPTHAFESTNADCVAKHWLIEELRCQKELRRWQEFDDTQQWIREHRSNKAREEDTKRQRYPQNSDLTASLKKLKDWKKYQAYFKRYINRIENIIEEIRQAMKAIQRKDPEVIVNKGTVRGKNDRDWLRFIEGRRELLLAEEKRLEWVKQQLPAILSECAASLMGLSTSRRQMKERSELEARRVYITLMKTDERSTRPIRSMPDSHDHENTDEHLHVLCHWKGECSQFEEELREWKEFLNYRQKKETDEKTKVQLKERQCAESSTQVNLWKNYRAYQQLKVDNAKQWVEFWQRQVGEFQNAENKCLRYASEAEARSKTLRVKGWHKVVKSARGDAQRYHSMAGNMQSHAENARKQVESSEARLKWVEQQLSALLAECVVSTTKVSTSDHLENQAKSSKRASRSSQTMLKNLRPDRSDRSTLRGNQQTDQNKKHSSANSALDSIHSSKVSKAAERKASRPRRRSTIPAEHGDDQNQGPHTTIPSSLPANVASRRSSRLEYNQKKSSALKADPAADLSRSAQPSPTNIIMRRSDRIFKQKERTSTSDFSAAVNSALISQKAPLRHLSRPKPKGRLAGNKSDPSPVKPRGISKRQESNFSRNRTKIHGWG